MWEFLKKKKSIVNPLPENACMGHLMQVHKVDGQILRQHLRCVSKKDSIKGVEATRMRIFDIREVEKRGITVAGWETFDQYPDLLAFEGYVAYNKAFFERKNF